MAQYKIIKGIYKKTFDPNLDSETIENIDVTAVVRSPDEDRSLFYVASLEWEDPRGTGSHRKLEWEDETLGSLLEMEVTDKPIRDIKIDRTAHSFQFVQESNYSGTPDDFKALFYDGIKEIGLNEKKITFTKDTLLMALDNS